MGAAFYALPGGRYCVALSRHAGAEHTGRGGQRVYTHNLILSDKDLAKCGFNPFAVIRAMEKAPIELPKVASGTAIPAFELTIDDAVVARPGGAVGHTISSDARSAALDLFLDGKPLVVDVAGDWISWAEALILAAPVPLRLELSFAAGIKFSTGRGHTLHLIRDEKNAAQGRVSAQGIAFIGSKTAAAAAHSQWASMVERHWSAGDLRGLARRTSRFYEDCSMAARERLAELFNHIDLLSKTESGAILDLVFRTLNAPNTGGEGEVRRELRDAAQQQLKSRFANSVWQQSKPLWPRLVEFWRNGGAAAAFVQPLVGEALMAAARSEPVAAAEMAISVAQAPGGADRNTHEMLLQQFFTRLTVAHASLPSDAIDRLAAIMQRWRTVRPTCPAVAQLCERPAPAQA
jgi:hypothetical protein